MAERRFPIQGEWGGHGVGEIPPSTVPWSEAEIAYQTYSTLFGSEQSLETLAARGGFGIKEFQVLRSGHDFRGRKVIDVPPVDTPKDTEAKP